MAKLFLKNVRTINERIRNKREELVIEPTIRQLRIVQKESNRDVKRIAQRARLTAIKKSSAPCPMRCAIKNSYLLTSTSSP